MKKVQWNKVTWYSKIIALILFVVLPFIGFWYGMQYGELIEPLQVQAIPPPGTSVTGSAGVGGATGVTQADIAAYYSNPAEWQTDSNFAGGFNITYPIDFTTQENFSAAPTTDWRENSNGTNGTQYFSLTIPAAFEPQTNFLDATLTVGASQSQQAVAQCLMADASGVPPGATSTITINGVQFTIFHSSDAGAGNYYQTTSYRTLHNGACYAIEYTLHSAQIANYPSEYNLQPFNESQLTSLLDRMVGTVNLQ